MAKILVVDDSAVDRQLIGGLLSAESRWEIEFAENGRQAFEILEQAPSLDDAPDAVVTDLRMPEMDGLELVKAVRENHPHIPVVLVTSYGSEKIANDALRAGATNYTPKDQLSQHLVRTVRHTLELAKHMKFSVQEGVQRVSRQIGFVLENELCQIGPTIEHLQENLPSWSDRDRLQIGMALDEALVNAIHHGNLEVDSSLREGECESRYYELIQERKTTPPYCDRRVRVEAEFSDQHICVQISDDGPGFAPDDIPDPTAEENLLRASGRGLFLIRSFMDQVAHNEKGNQITLTKLRQSDAVPAEAS